MNLPFTEADFFQIFVRYNEATWPMPLVLAGLAGLALVELVRKSRHCDRLASAVLGLLWLWAGSVYHLGFFVEVSPAALVFGALFVLQSAEFFRRGVARHGIVFDAHRWNVRTIAGAVVMLYALAIYPLLGAAFGHRWPEGPTFGAPCPVVLFTFGLLLWTSSPLPRWVLIVPLGWAVIGTSAAIEFGVYEDWALPVAGILAAVWLWRRPIEHHVARLAPPSLRRKMGH